MSTTATDPRGRPRRVRGAIFALAVALLAASLAFEPPGLAAIDAYGYGLRVTARLSFAFFILAYVARPLAQVSAGAPRTLAQWLVLNRRYLGLAAAFVHTVHFGYVVAYTQASGEPVAPVTLVFGGLAFVLFWLMAATSNDRAKRALGANWRRLHRFGMHYIWIIFFQSFLPRAFEEPGYWLPTLLGVAGLGLRIAAHRRTRRLLAAAGTASENPA